MEALAEADEVWVPSNFVRESYVQSGLSPERVVVVPHGVNPMRFRPGVPPLRLATSKRFRFLFVGGTLFRKGADILLETYLRCFTAEDDVCLVIKDAGTTSFYRGQGLGETIRALQQDPSNPEILYLEGEWPHDEIAALYTACHCLVHPYRAEGFGLPIAEAMACGLAVIVPDYGACLDFCDPTVSRLLPVMEARSALSRLGELETVDSPRWAEVDRDALASAMLDAVANPKEARRLGLRASEKILREFNWARAAERIAQRLDALAVSKPRSAPAPTKRARGPRLSVAMIVRNEATYLRSCLESVQCLADQVVVVDTGSTDNTVAIAEELGAEVHHFEWTDDFAAARNESLRHATGAWILVLDGDEWLDPASHETVRRLIGGEEMHGYLVRILNYTAAIGDAEIVEHQTLRLFPNHPELRFQGRDPHAQLRALSDEARLTLCSSDVILHHEGYRPQILAAKQKHARNRVSLEREVRNAPNDPFAAFNLGLTYNLLGRHADAERELLRSLALSVRETSSSERPSYVVTACLQLAVAVFRQGRYEEAAGYAEQVIALAPDASDAYVTLGSALLRLGRLEQAAEAYLKAVKCADRPATVASDRSTSSWKPLLGLAEVEMARERWAEALRWLQRAHTVTPENALVATGVARASLGLGDKETARTVLAEVVDREDAPPEARLLLNLACQPPEPR
jgi:tetratricopeptide (TPR) repeat protein